MTHHPPRPRRTPLLQGFTLIEMLVVMTLIATLLTLAVPRYFKAMDSARWRVQQQNQFTLRDAIDKYFGDQGHYPNALSDLVDKRYLRQIPLDPVSESDNWVLVPPQDASLGRIYDVLPAPANNATASTNTTGNTTAAEAPPYGEKP